MGENRTPWKVELVNGLLWIEDSTGNAVTCGEAFCGYPGGKKYYDTYKHIVKCVNLHDDLVKFVESFVSTYECGDDFPEWRFKEAKQLLSQAKDA